MGLINNNIDKMRAEYLAYAKAYTSETGQTTKQFNEHARSLMTLHNITNPEPRDWVNAAIEVWDTFTRDSDDLAECQGLYRDRALDIDGMDW
jgi:hypothetical protein